MFRSIAAKLYSPRSDNIQLIRNLVVRISTSSSRAQPKTTEKLEAKVDLDKLDKIKVPESNSFVQNLFAGRANTEFFLPYPQVLNDEEIMFIVREYGPIYTTIHIDDATMKHYKTGVYQHLLGTESVGHSIKIIGWGIENGIPYWLCANSWTPLWGGMGGFFKILRGQNHCGIESQVYGGWPRL